MEQRLATITYHLISQFLSQVPYDQEDLKRGEGAYRAAVDGLLRSKSLITVETKQAHLLLIALDLLRNVSEADFGSVSGRWKDINWGVKLADYCSEHAAVQLMSIAIEFEDNRAEQNGVEQSGEGELEDSVSGSAQGEGDDGSSQEPNNGGASASASVDETSSRSPEGKEKDSAFLRRDRKRHRSWSDTNYVALKRAKYLKKLEELDKLDTLVRGEDAMEPAHQNGVKAASVAGKVDKPEQAAEPKSILKKAANRPLPYPNGKKRTRDTVKSNARPPKRMKLAKPETFLQKVGLGISTILSRLFSSSESLEPSLNGHTTSSDEEEDASAVLPSEALDQDDTGDLPMQVPQTPIPQPSLPSSVEMKIPAQTKTLDRRHSVDSIQQPEFGKHDIREQNVKRYGHWAPSAGLGDSSTVHMLRGPFADTPRRLRPRPFAQNSPGGTLFYNRTAPSPLYVPPASPKAKQKTTPKVRFAASEANSSVAQPRDDVPDVDQHQGQQRIGTTAATASMPPPPVPAARSSKTSIPFPLPRASFPGPRPSSPYVEPPASMPEPLHSDPTPEKERGPAQGGPPALVPPVETMDLMELFTTIRQCDSATPKQQPTESDKMAEVLKKWGFQEEETTGDGNCLFNAISLQLFGHERQSSGLRQMAMNYILKHKDKYNTIAFTNDMEPPYESAEQYVEYMSKDGNWGDAISLGVLAEAIGFQAVVFSLSGARFSTNVHPSGKIIYLCYYRNFHYASARYMYK